MAMNRSADPCQDFFQFACGTWNKKHLIPEDRSSISTFEVLADQLQVILKGIIINYSNFIRMIDKDLSKCEATVISFSVLVSQLCVIHKNVLLGFDG